MAIRSVVRTFLQIRQSKNGLLNRCVASPVTLNRRIEKSTSSTRNDGDDEEDLDKPIKFSATKASTWKACDTGRTNMDAPPYHNFVISMSISTFLIYFCILREENDIDEMLNRDLYDHFKDKPNSTNEA